MLVSHVGLDPVQVMGDIHEAIRHGTAADVDDESANANQLIIVDSRRASIALTDAIGGRLGCWHQAEDALVIEVEQLLAVGCTDCLALAHLQALAERPLMGRGSPAGEGDLGASRRRLAGQCYGLYVGAQRQWLLEHKQCQIIDPIGVFPVHDNAINLSQLTPGQALDAAHSHQESAGRIAAGRKRVINANAGRLVQLSEALPFNAAGGDAMGCCQADLIADQSTSTEVETLALQRDTVRMRADSSRLACKQSTRGRRRKGTSCTKQQQEQPTVLNSAHFGLNSN